MNVITEGVHLQRRVETSAWLECARNVEENEAAGHRVTVLGEWKTPEALPGKNKLAECYTLCR